LARERDDRRAEVQSYGARLQAAAREHQLLLEDRNRRVEERDRLIAELRQSLSWRITAPLRAIWRLLR
jgi:hypothetical protein